MMNNLSVSEITARIIGIEAGRKRKPRRRLAVILFSGWLSCALLEAEPAGDWKTVLRFPTEEVHPLTHQVRAMIDGKDNLWLFGPGVVERRDSKTGKQFWRSKISGEKGWLGVIINSVGNGVMISQIIDKPAKLAGFQVRDIITHIGEEQILNTNALIKHVKNIEPGTSLEVRYQRKGKETKTKVTFGARPRNRLYAGQDTRQAVFAFGYQVFSLNPKTGKIEWSVDLEPLPGYDQLNIQTRFYWQNAIHPVGRSNSGRWLFSVNALRVIALDPNHGQPMWSYDAATRMAAEPILKDNYAMFVRLGKNQLFRLNADDGTDGPQNNLPENFPGISLKFLTQIPQGWLAGDDSSLFFLEGSSGKVGWQKSFEDGVFKYVIPAGESAICQVTSQLKAFKTLTGAPAWEASLPENSKIAEHVWSEKKLILRMSDSSLHAFDTADGRSLWKHDPLAEKPPKVTLVIVGNDLMRIVTRTVEEQTDTEWTVLDISSGTEKQKLQLKGGQVNTAGYPGGCCLITSKETLIMQRSPDAK